MKYAIMSQSASVAEAAEESDESTDSSSSGDEDDTPEQAEQVQSCAGKLGYMLAFVLAITAIYTTLGVLANFEESRAWSWLSVQLMAHGFKFFIDEPGKIVVIYFFGGRFGWWWARCNKLC